LTKQNQIFNDTNPSQTKPKKSISLCAGRGREWRTRPPLPAYIFA